MPKRTPPRRDANIIKKQPDIIMRPIRPVDLVYALRRRWALSLGLGLLVTAITLLVAWFVIPVEYNAHVWLSVAKNRHKIFYDIAQEEHYLNDRNAQATLIKSSIVLEPALQQSGIAQLKCMRDEKDKVGWLSRKLSVGYLQGSEILQISISGENRTDLEKILTAVRDSYLQAVVQVDHDLETSRHAILERSFRDLEKKISRKEIQYRNRANQLGASDQKTASYANIYALEEISTLRSRVNELRSTISGRDMRISLLSAKLQLYPEDESTKLDPEEKRQETIRRLAGSAVAQDAEIVRMKQQLANLDSLVKEQTERVRNPESNPSILKLKETREALVKAMETRVKEIIPLIEERVRMASANYTAPLTAAEQIHSEIENIKLERDVFQKELDTTMKAYQAEVASAERFSSGGSELDNMRNELDRMKRMYEQMGTQLEQWTVEANASARVSSIKEPEASLMNNMEEKVKIMGFLGIISFIGTVIAVSGFDFLGRRVNNTDELSFGLGVHVMGDLPLISRGFHRHRLNQSVQGLLMESIDNIRTALLHRAEREGMKAVLITSSLEKEGKTTVSSQLAASLARTGRKVVLVDCDLRRPSAHRMFDRPLNPGMAEFLRHKATLDEIITNTRVENLWIIPAGTPHPQAIVSLAQGGMEEPMRLLREQFDFIIVDSGPVLTDADVLVVGRLCDGIIVSVLRDVSRLPWVYEACERIRMVDIPLLGTVLNGVSFGKYRPYYSSYTIEISSKPRIKKS